MWQMAGSHAHGSSMGKLATFRPSSFVSPDRQGSWRMPSAALAIRGGDISKARRSLCTYRHAHVGRVGATSARIHGASVLVPKRA